MTRKHAQLQISKEVKAEVGYDFPCHIGLHGQF